MRAISLSVLALFFSTAVAVAQPSMGDGRTPEDVANAYFTAFKAGRLKDVAGLMHPEALASLKRMVVPIFSMAGNAEDKAEMAKVFGIKDAATAEKMTPEEFFTAFMNGIYNVADGMKEAMESFDARIIGHVQEGADSAHILYRMVGNTHGMGINKISVISMKQSPAGWRVLLTGEMEGIAAMMGASASDDEGDNVEMEDAQE